MEQGKTYIAKSNLVNVNISSLFEGENYLNDGIDISIMSESNDFSNLIEKFTKALGNKKIEKGANYLVKYLERENSQISYIELINVLTLDEVVLGMIDEELFIELRRK